MLNDYTIVSEEEEWILVRSPDGRGTVLQIDRKAVQVVRGLTNAEHRLSGASFVMGPISDYGIRYCAQWLSWEYARRRFRQYVQETRKMNEAVKGAK